MAKKDSQNYKLVDRDGLAEQLAKLAVEYDGEGTNLELRNKVLQILKSTNVEARKAAEQLLLDGGKGRDCARRLSVLQDDLIKIIFDFACAHVFSPDSKNIKQKAGLALVAVGGYGRGTMAPGSDIDLLFLVEDQINTQAEPVIEYILYLLWDMGFKVGHATRDVNECLAQAKNDMTIRTSILEARYLLGDRDLFKQMFERFDKEIVANSAAEFIEAKLSERDQRHTKSGESRYLVEPDVKDGKGGFRDLHTLFWIGKYYYRVAKQAQLVKVGLFTKGEYRQFKRAEEFLWTVRCHLHFVTGRAQERLSFDIQREMAERLNYITRGGLLDVERFMKHYFLVAKQVGDLTLIVCAQLEEEQAKSVKGINGLIRSLTRKRNKTIPDTQDFINDNGRINIASDQSFINDPLNLIRLFKLADDNNLDFHPDALQLATQSLKLITNTVRKDKQANAIFLEVLANSSRPVFLLRKMNECGVLGRFIPSFRRIVAMMQFNMYHHYTVDEHLLRTVGILAKIDNGKLAEEHPMSHAILPDIEDKIPLYVAALLHDIAKGREEDHSIAGARIAKRLCPRLGLSKKQTDMVSWLILEHLTMSNTAQSRDLSDFKTIETFAECVKNIDRLRNLLVLTVCDTRAVGPGVWNGWKGQLLRTLYDQTEPLLTGDFLHQTRKTRAAEAKRELASNLVDWTHAELDRVLALPYDPYFLSTAIETQIRHMGFIKRSDAAKEIFAYDVHVSEFEQITEISVLAPDHPHLLSAIAGVCASSNANIAGAQVETLRDGRALDTILINREFDDDNDELRRANAIGKLIGEILSGQTKPRPQSSLAKSQEAKLSAFDVKAKVLIDNELSNKFTVIEVEGLDRHGLLAQLADELSNLSLDIGSAHIVTFGEKIVDTFYVTDLTGNKIDDKNRKSKIKSALKKILKRKT